MKHIYTFIAVMLLLFPLYSWAGVTYFINSAAFEQASNANLVETFESLGPTDTALSSIYSNGINYKGYSNVWLASAGYGNFGVAGVTQSVVLTATGAENFEITFDNPTIALGFDTYINAYGPAEIKIYGANGLIESFVHTHNYQAVGFFGVTSDEAIHSFTYITTGGASVNTGIDNMRVGESISSIEILATPWLLGLGLLSVMVTRRSVFSF